MTGHYDVAELDPATVAFRRSPGGVMTMESNGESYPEVLLYRTFPLSMPTQFISVRSSNGEEIGVIADLDSLDERSRREAERELTLRYLVPKVIRIERIKQNPGMWVWELETTLGPLKLTMRNLYEHLQSPAPGRLLISDMDGNRCEIENMEQLDANSKKWLRKFL
ncbi:DUF1854 domain-containing protein [Paenibacillus sp. MBLB4367]|uniref:DUF1854 domain-containing protein n=1 Tax=Paenibacillus sp. MBLB4367 TaxID=3384767 RepID=UPI0039081CF0